MLFVILGPHTLNYGEDKDGDEHDQGVHMIFRPECLRHPDVFVTPMAATFYNSGHGGQERPWWKKDKDQERPSAFDAMAFEKLHPSSPLFHEALAWEFFARVARKNSGDLSETHFDGMLTYPKATNARHVVECHLPYATPLAWVEQAVISEHTFKKLSKADQRSVRTIFGSRLVVVPGVKSQEEQWKLATA